MKRLTPFDITDFWVFQIGASSKQLVTAQKLSTKGALKRIYQGFGGTILVLHHDTQSFFSNRRTQLLWI